MPTPRPQLLALALAAGLLAHAAGLLAPAAAAAPARFQGWTPLSNYVAAGLAEGGSFRLTVPTRSGNVEVKLHPAALHGPGYHAEEAVERGTRRGRARPRLRAFAGKVEHARARHGRGGDFARVALEPGGRISGLMRVDGVLYDLAADAAAGDLVLHVREVLAEELAEVLEACGVEAGDVLASGSGTASAEEPATAVASALREIELGTEADAPFVAQVGGVDEANERILSMVNSINGIYEFDLGLTNRVVFQRAWNGSDPYTSNDSDTLLSEFRSSFLGGVATPTDEAQLFSGRDFDGSTVGRAWVESTCTSFRFGVNQFYRQSDSLTRLIVAHEMGHNLGANHSADGIMAPSINPDVTWFSAESQSEIADYLDGVSCLAELDPGAAPVLDPIGPQDAPENQLLQLQLSASDPDGDPITWSALPLPLGATLSANGLFRWTPPLDSVGCGGFEEVAVTFTARDPGGNLDSETVTLSVLDTPTGAPPAFSDPADRSVIPGQPITIPLVASDPDGDSVVFGVVNPPAGASLSAQGLFTWTPTSGQLGVHDVGFSATDCTGEVSSENVLIEVVSSAPQLASLSAGTGWKGDEIMLSGQYLAGAKVKVWFGPKKAEVLSVDPDSLLVRVPKKKRKSPDTVAVNVMRDGLVSENSLSFTYVEPPL
jgi:hypothetical protein